MKLEAAAPANRSAPVPASVKPKALAPEPTNRSSPVAATLAAKLDAAVPVIAGAGAAARNRIGRPTG